MGGRGARADVERFGDIATRSAIDHQTKHLHFAFGQSELGGGGQIDVRSRGRWLLDPAAGVDLAAQSIEGSLSFPLWVLGGPAPEVGAARPSPSP